MDRRSTLLALGGALPVLLAARGARASADTAPATAPITSYDYATETLRYGTLAKDTSILAIERTNTAFVRDFAKGEYIEQTAVAQALTSNPNPPPPPLTLAQRNTFNAVRNAPASSFDSVYLQAQIAGHKSLLIIQNNLIATDTAPTDDYLHIALIARAFIENHLFILNLLLANISSQ